MFLSKEEEDFIKIYKDKNIFADKGSNLRYVNPEVIALIAFRKWYKETNLSKV